MQKRWRLLKNGLMMNFAALMARLNGLLIGPCNKLNVKKRKAKTVLSEQQHIVLLSLKIKLKKLWSTLIINVQNAATEHSILMNSGPLVACSPNYLIFKIKDSLPFLATSVLILKFTKPKVVN